MINYYPNYYKDFQCIADKCRDTCCNSWQVVVDSDTATYYEKLKTEYGEYISSKMYRDNEGDIVFKNTDNHCPFLNSQQLCDIHINLGGKHTPKTCKMFPRFETSFGGTAEWGLSLSCPVASELIISNNTFDLDAEFDDELPDINDIDADLFLSLKSVRKKCVDYINKSDLSFLKLNALVAFGKAVEECADSGDFEKLEALDITTFEQVGTSKIPDKNVFEKFEYLTPKGERLLKNNSFPLPFEFTKESKNILLYYVYRYFLKSVYDGDIYFALAFSAFSTAIICSVAENSKLPLADVARIYSKEIEHSQGNIQILCKNL